MGTRPQFCHLHVHSHFSLLDGACRLDDMIDAAAADEQPAIGITDHGNLFGAIPFYKSCKAKGVRPVLGIEAYLAGKSRNERADNKTNPTYHMTLLAENDVGWKNLIKLSSISFRDGFYRKPRIDREDLSKYGEGIIALSGCLGGEVNQRILQKDYDEALKVVGEMCELLGKDNYFLEIMDNGYHEQPAANAAVLELSKRSGCPAVATNDVHYLRHEDWRAQDILLCINTGKSVQEQNRFKMEGDQLYLKSREEMARVFPDNLDTLERTVEIAQRCNVEIDFDTYHLPNFTPDTGESPDAMFTRLCDEGAMRRYGEINEKIRTRLDYEAGIIRKLGFVSYFLITWDFLRHAREVHVPVGPGRGSAAGSIVAYCLEITDIDPLRYDLLFERFLNAERISMPDIDIDFCRDGRERVIEYVRDKYGEENVSQIITFGTMASRGVIRDVGRALDIQLREIDQIAKKVPNGPGASLKEALETDPELQDIRKQDEAKENLFEIGVKLEGLCRHASTHAAGVVIADKPLDEYVPLYRNGEDITTQWQMTDLEEVGLLKVDFLGLKTLTIIAEAERLILEQHGKTLDLRNLPLDDEPTYKLLSKGTTLGVFQLESDGMRELIARLQPSCFEDVVALIALYRPGPLKSGMADMYVERKHGRQKVEYPHEVAKPILEDTYGVIVYQEQVMLIAHHLAGFTLNEADSLRKAMGKKKPEVMAKFRSKFVEGSIEQGHKKKMADDLFTTMEFFAGYGFNKSHSAAYAVLTYRTAWLKANYPTEFMCALLTCDMGLTDKVKEFIDETKRMGIPVRLPDINASQTKFSVERDDESGPTGAIRYGLGALKGLGEKASDRLVQAREEKGRFVDISDLAQRWPAQVANKTCYEVLAKSGAIESTGWTRRAAFDEIEPTLREAASVQKDLARGQNLLFGAPSGGEAGGPAKARDIPDVPEWPENVKLTLEKEAVGFFLSGHPFERRGKFFSLLAGQDTRDLMRIAQAEEAAIENGTQGRGRSDRQEIILAGMVSGLRPMVIKNGRNAGQRMARFRLEDLHDSVSCTVFSKQYAEVQHKLENDALVFVRARLDRSGEEVAILIDDVLGAEEYVREHVDALVLSLQEDEHGEAELEAVCDTLKEHKGAHRLLIQVAAKSGARFRLFADSQWGVNLSADLLEGLSKTLGQSSLSFTRR